MANKHQLQFKHLLLLGFVIILVATPLTAFAFTYATLEHTPPSFFSFDGVLARYLVVGQQVMISSTFTYTYHEVLIDQPPQQYIAIIEVRDESGITQSLSYQSSEIALNDTITIGASWSPEEPITYVARSFAYTSYNGTVLTDVRVSDRCKIAVPCASSIRYLSSAFLAKLKARRA